MKHIEVWCFTVAPHVHKLQIILYLPSTSSLWFSMDFMDESLFMIFIRLDRCLNSPIYPRRFFPTESSDTSCKMARDMPRDPFESQQKLKLFAFGSSSVLSSVYSHLGFQFLNRNIEKNMYAPGDSKWPFLSMIWTWYGIIHSLSGPVTPKTLKKFWGLVNSKSTSLNHIPNNPCMVYCPTFTININQM